jgi:hypothetical protein
MKCYNKTSLYIAGKGEKVVFSFSSRKNNISTKRCGTDGQIRLYLQPERRYRIYALSDLITELKSSI